MTEPLDLDAIEAELAPEKWVDIRLGAKVCTLVAEARAARASIQRVRDLHNDSGAWCTGCDYGWPCPTIRVLDS